MDPTIYAFLHVLSGFVLVGWTYAAFAAPRPERRRTTLIVTGIAAAVMFVAGFGLQAKLQLGFPGWLIVKMVCWLGLILLAVMAFRRPEQVKTLSGVAFLLVAVAVGCVYFRPF